MMCPVILTPTLRNACIALHCIALHCTFTPVWTMSRVILNCHTMHDAVKPAPYFQHFSFHIETGFCANEQGRMFTMSCLAASMQTVISKLNIHLYNVYHTHTMNIYTCIHSTEYKCTLYVHVYKERGASSSLVNSTNSPSPANRLLPTLSHN